jgi:hypothetical protein
MGGNQHMAKHYGMQENKTFQRAQRKFSSCNMLFASNTGEQLS